MAANPEVQGQTTNDNDGKEYQSRKWRLALAIFHGSALVAVGGVAATFGILRLQLIPAEDWYRALWWAATWLGVMWGGVGAGYSVANVAQDWVRQANPDDAKPKS